MTVTDDFFPVRRFRFQGGRQFLRRRTDRLRANERKARAHIALVQTLGGSGALKVGADFLARYMSGACVWVSDPTWDNYYGIFGGAGIEVRQYSYFDPVSSHVDFCDMLASVETMPRGDVILLQPSCHNPTGADLTDEQWDELASVIEARGLLPFFDMAYQGLGRGLDQDAYAIRHFAARGIPMLVATSFSKNFSLYGERCGSLGIVCDDAETAGRVLGQLKATIRRIYSSPPVHGARIVRMVLEDTQLQLDWRSELENMRTRIGAMRTGLHDALKTRCPDADFDFITRQSGMFSYSPLLAKHALQLREQSGVYVLNSGRICLAALTEAAIAPVSNAIARSLNEPPCSRVPMSSESQSSTSDEMTVLSAKS
jgi:aromatic-amino-acid transaminase